MRYEGEVRQVSLYTRVEYYLRSRVAQRRTVLIKKIHQLFGDLSVEQLLH